MKDKKKKLIILTAAALCLILIISIIVVRTYRKNMQVWTSDDNLQIDAFQITSSLEAACELNTAELYYHGAVFYSEGSVPLLTKKSFFMMFDAEVKAGTDFSGFDGSRDITITDHTVQITLPPVIISEPVIDPDSIEFIDASSAIFNSSDKNDAIDSIQAAKTDVLENINQNELIEKARTELELFLENILRPLIGDRDLIIRYEQK